MYYIACGMGFVFTIKNGIVQYTENVNYAFPFTSFEKADSFAKISAHLSRYVVLKTA